MNQLLLVLICFISCSLKAQDTISIFPGSKEIQYAKIKPGVIKSNFIVIRNNERKGYGVYTDSVAFVKSGNRKLLVRYSFFPFKNLYDTGFYIPETLAPVSNTEYSSSGVMKLNYSADQVSGENFLKAKDSLITIRETMPAPFFDAYLNDFIPRFLDLKEGYCARMPVYAFGSTGVTWITVSVTGTENVLASNGENYTVWIVNVRWPNSPFTVNLYVDKTSRATLMAHSKGPNLEIIKMRISF